MPYRPRPPVAPRTIEERCRRLVEPEIVALGMSLWHVRFFRGDVDWILEITVDKPGGVTVGDCVAVSNVLNPLLDEADPIPQAYCLEVQSPGIERRLFTVEHYEQCLGQQAQLTVYRPRWKDYYTLVGRLTQVDGLRVFIETEEAEEFAELANVREAHLLNTRAGQDEYRMTCDEAELNWINIKPVGKRGRKPKPKPGTETEDQKP